MFAPQDFQTRLLCHHLSSRDKEDRWFSCNNWCTYVHQRPGWSHSRWSFRGLQSFCRHYYVKIGTLHHKWNRGTVASSRRTTSKALPCGFAYLFPYCCCCYLTPIVYKKWKIESPIRFLLWWSWSFSILLHRFVFFSFFSIYSHSNPTLECLDHCSSYLSNLQKSRSLYRTLLAQVRSNCFSNSSCQFLSTVHSWKWVQHCLSFGLPSSIDDPLWYLDSGTTHHITNNSSIYYEKQPYDNTDLVKMGNSKGFFNISHWFYEFSFFYFK